MSSFCTSCPCRWLRAIRLRPFILFKNSGLETYLVKLRPLYLFLQSAPAGSGFTNWDTRGDQNLLIDTSVYGRPFTAGGRLFAGVPQLVKEMNIERCYGTDPRQKSIERWVLDGRVQIPGIRLCRVKLTIGTGWNHVQCWHVGLRPHHRFRGDYERRRSLCRRVVARSYRWAQILSFVLPINSVKTGAHCW